MSTVYPPFFTAAEMQDMRLEEEAGMQWTYTRTPLLEGATDGWYDPVLFYGAPITALKCALKIPNTSVPGARADDLSNVNTGDTRSIVRPVLVVPLADTLKAGDKVGHFVCIPTGAVWEHEYRVETVLVVGWDIPTFKTASLAGMQ